MDQKSLCPDKDLQEQVKKGKTISDMSTIDVECDVKYIYNAMRDVTNVDKCDDADYVVWSLLTYDSYDSAPVV